MRFEQLTIEDASESMAALAVQGPRSRELLAGCVDGDVEGLRFFRITEATIAGRPVQLSRTGFTGDLGYELWIDRDDALAVWDAVVEAGAPYRLLPAGLDAMDVTRIEAGFVLSGVDYFNALHCLIDARKSSPFEIGLGRAVTLDRCSSRGSS